MKNTLVKNSIFNALYNVVNTIFPLISVTYASHILMDTGIGKAVSAQNIAQYFVTLAPLGIPNYGIREIAGKRKDKEQKSKIFTELLLLNTISTFFFVCIYYMLILFVPVFKQEQKLYIIAGLAIVCNFMNVDWYYQGIEEFKYIATRNFTVKCITICLLFMGVRKSDDYIVYVLISVLATMGNYLINVINLKKYEITFKIKGFVLIKHIKPICILLATNLAIELYTLLDTTMITIFCPVENVAYYNNSMKLVRLLITVIAAFGGVLLPRLSSYYESGEYEKCSEIVNKVFEVMYAMFLPCGMGLYLISDNLIPILFGNSFTPGIITLKLATLLIGALGFSNLFGTQILLTFKSELRLLICTIVGALSNICMNLILIPKYQHNGAVVASVISEGLVTLVAFIFSIRYIRFRPNKRIIITTTVTTLFMAMTILVVNQYINSKITELIIDILVGVIAYVGSNFLLKNPVIKNIIQNL